MSSASELWLELTRKSGRISEEEAFSAFDQLPSVCPESVIGEWRGYDLDTGHPGIQKNKDLKWAGKSFVTVDDVKPMMVFNDAGERVWKEDIGGARLRKIEYREVLSTAMIYNTKPIIDHFRKVTDTMVAGVMDSPLMKESGPYYFYLIKI